MSYNTISWLKILVNIFTTMGVGMEIMLWITFQGTKVRLSSFKKIEFENRSKLLFASACTQYLCKKFQKPLNTSLSDQNCCSFCVPMTVYRYDHLDSSLFLQYGNSLIAIQYIVNTFQLLLNLDHVNICIIDVLQNMKRFC